MTPKLNELVPEGPLVRVANRVIERIDLNSLLPSMPEVARAQSIC